MDETAFRAYVFDAQSAIDRGDVELTTAIVDEVTARLPCLSFSPEPSLWADLLVSMSIVTYSRSGAWQEPLSAALRIRKGIDRGVGPGHPIYNFEPPPEPSMGAPVPPNARLLIDGRPSPVLPPEEGLWLVQKTDGRYWNTLLLQDQPLPEDWATAAVVAPPRMVAWARVGGSFGVGALDSVASFSSPRFPLQSSDTGWPIGAQGDLHATFYSPFGFLASGRVSWFPDSPGLDGRVSAIAERGLVTVGAGVGLSTVDVVVQQADPVVPGAIERTTLSPGVQYGVGTLVLHPRHRPPADGGRPFDTSLAVGGSAQGYLVDLDAGIATRFGQDQLLRFGALLAVRSGSFVWTSVPGSTVDASSFRLLLRADFVFGEY
jgi:hypothetical protein